ncbi:sym-3a [Anaeramoeba ignava]|uniref:Sym-3a n=1 Tax=Anaeramoeba ignava TaxID=1746090 RepID=A0A9Q0R6I0_ANAIG|nr:sym-3a [Anaeramoeba ignava]
MNQIGKKIVKTYFRILIISITEILEEDSIIYISWKINNSTGETQKSIIKSAKAEWTEEFKIPITLSYNKKTNKMDPKYFQLFVKIERPKLLSKRSLETIGKVEFNLVDYLNIRKPIFEQFNLEIDQQIVHKTTPKLNIALSFPESPESNVDWVLLTSLEIEQKINLLNKNHMEWFRNQKFEKEQYRDVFNDDEFEDPSKSNSENEGDDYFNYFDKNSNENSNENQNQKSSPVLSQDSNQDLSQILKQILNEDSIENPNPNPNQYSKNHFLSNSNSDSDSDSIEEIVFPNNENNLNMQDNLEMMSKNSNFLFSNKKEENVDQEKQRIQNITKEYNFHLIQNQELYIIENLFFHSYPSFHQNKFPVPGCFIYKFFKDLNLFEDGDYNRNSRKMIILKNFTDLIQFLAQKNNENLNYQIWLLQNIHFILVLLASEFQLGVLSLNEFGMSKYNSFIRLNENKFGDSTGEITLTPTPQRQEDNIEENNLIVSRFKEMLFDIFFQVFWSIIRLILKDFSNMIVFAFLGQEIATPMPPNFLQNNTHKKSKNQKSKNQKSKNQKSKNQKSKNSEKNIQFQKESHQIKPDLIIHNFSRFLDISKHYQLPNQIILSIFRQLMFEINKKLFSEILKNHDLETHSNANEFKYSLSKLGDWLTEQGFQEALKEVSQVNDAANCILEKNSFIQKNQINSQALFKVAPSLTYSQVYSLLSNFKPDHYDPKFIPQEVLNDLFDLMKQSVDPPSSVIKNLAKNLVFDLSDFDITNWETIEIPQNLIKDHRFNFELIKNISFF